MHPEFLFTLDGFISFITLSVMEIVLGIDNIVFISIVSSKLPVKERAKARFIGLAMALLIRILLLFLITSIMRMQNPLFSVLGKEISIRDLILLAGGLFLLAKTTSEIHGKLETEIGGKHKKHISVRNAIIQIVALDVVFSFDSILTAIGLSNEVAVMIAAVIVSMVIMLIFSAKVADYIEKHPSLKMLALSFLLMIGALLVSEAILPEDKRLPKSYVYFAMAFSFFVEILNIRVKNKSKVIKLNNPTIENAEEISTRKEH